ncbi:MAG TPA: transporter substrate-binding domain-containing protein, partial [Sphingomicrobium sp.]|nr:transporter substrate-binding domain-containing protein [Sphingomicrobium sp.]
MRLLVYASLAALLNTCSLTPSLIDRILERGELRVVTRHAPTTYSIGPDGPRGPEFDLVRGFADEIGVTLVVETVDAVSDVLPRLLSGEADIAAAGLSMTDSRREFVDFGFPYTAVDMHLIYRLGDVKPRSIEDLVGSRIEVVA